MTLTFSEARAMWAKIGLLSFGGPAGQIALMHREVIEERSLISEREFLSALNFCMLLPGPEAMQLATYVGWKLHGWRGGLTAGLLFVLPGAAMMFVLATLYALFGKLPLIESLFWGVKAAVLAIVLQALLRVAKKALKGPMDYAIALVAFIALFAFALPFPLIICVAALLGFAWPDKSAEALPPQSLPPFGKTLGTIALWLGLWLAPLLALNVFAPASTLTGLGNFFSRLSVVTFGGAYAVLSYMGQDVVEAHHWLEAPQMMDGLGLAETTPGPLILVGQFVGFLAAFRAQGSLWAGLLGGLVFLWMTFTPCFLWIFAGAPYLSSLQANPRFASALSRITAAVTGVILNLSLWFGLHVLFAKVERASGAIPIWLPDWQSFEPAAAVVAALAALAMLHFKWGMFKCLAMAASLGIIWKMFVPMM